MRTATVTYIINGAVGRMTIQGDDDLVAQISSDGRGSVRTKTKAYLWRRVEYIEVKADEERPIL